MFWSLSTKLRWNLVVLWVAGLCFWASIGTQLPTLPVYILTKVQTEQQVGLVMGAFALGLICARGPIGKMADQRSRKGVLLLGMAVAAIAPLCYLFAHTLGLLYVTRAFHGISIAAFTTAYVAMVVDLSPPEHRGEVLGGMSLTNPIGLMLGPSMGGFTQDALGHQALFLLATSLGLLGLVCTSGVQESQNPLSNVPSTTGQFWQHLWSPRLRVPVVVMLLMGVTFGAVLTFVPLLLKQSTIALNSGVFWSVSAIASLGIRVVTGRASDRLGRGRFISFGLVSYILAMVILWQADQSLEILIASIFQGWGSGMLIPMMATLMADRSLAHERARVFSLCIVGYDLGMAIAGPALGTVAMYLGIQNIFGVAGGFAICAVLVFMTCSSKDLPHSLAFALGRGKDVYALES